MAHSGRAQLSRYQLSSNMISSLQPTFPKTSGEISFLSSSTHLVKLHRKKIMEHLLDTITQKFWKCKQEINCLLSAIHEDMPDSKSMKELSQNELSEDEAWERFFADSISKRAEANALYETLCGLHGDKLFGDIILQDDSLSAEDKIFLKEFPEKKTELEERIQGLHAAADQIDRTHKKCAITNVIAGSASVLSGVMSILGLALVPITAGGSLILSASGIGLGAVASMTSLSSSVIERARNSAARERVSNYKGTRGQAAVAVLCREAPHVVSVAQKCVSMGNQVMEEIKKNIHAFRLAKANPCLTRTAKNFMTTGNLSTQSAQKVEKAFGGTALAMTKGSRMVSAISAGALVLVDMITFIHDLHHLLEGAKAEMAEELREQAQEMERKLEELSQAYNSLLDIITLQSNREGEAVDDMVGSTQ
ncbi:apolipoprotein L6-like isoform X2 [Notamacropus eugenii]|uniref:apolipoprotein L6-like isoform X2 n=1 Tax=Notamacropus eugenii TaxID=9315 RepID=UPI003B66CE8C